MRRLTIPSLLAATLLFGSGVAWAHDSANEQTKTGEQIIAPLDRDFAISAASDGIAEIKLGELALERAQSPRVRALAQRLVREHKMAGAELERIARAKDLELPAAMTPDAQRTYDELSKLAGAEFDKAYLDHMMEAHNHAIEKFRQETNIGKDRQLRNFADRTLKTLKQHRLATARSKRAM